MWIVDKIDVLYTLLPLAFAPCSLGYVGRSFVIGYVLYYTDVYHAKVLNALTACVNHLLRDGRLALTESQYTKCFTLKLRTSHHSGPGTFGASDRNRSRTGYGMGQGPGGGQRAFKGHSPSPLTTTRPPLSLFLSPSHPTSLIPSHLNCTR